MKRYAIFEGKKNKDKCLAIFYTEEEARTALREGIEWGKYPESATYYIVTENQNVGETKVH
jgi:hypothetical protein